MTRRPLIQEVRKKEDVQGIIMRVEGEGNNEVSESNGYAMYVSEGKKKRGGGKDVWGPFSQQHKKTLIQVVGAHKFKN